MKSKKIQSNKVQENSRIKRLRICLNLFIISCKSVG